MARTRIGLLGCGTVGSALMRAVCEAPLSRDWRVTRVAVRNLAANRDCDLSGATITADALAVASADDVDVVVECLGGIEVAGEAIRATLRRGLPVITANKALIAAHGRELAALATEHGTTLRFEAAVAAAIPVVRTLEHLAASDRITRVDAVLNGTCNFILSEMETTGSSYSDALAKAQALGYAEADPHRDVAGLDACDKIAILSELLWPGAVALETIYITGIDRITAADVRRAAADGKVWRLVASATAAGCAKVEPQLLPATHPLARLAGPENGVVIHAQRSGVLTLTGQGAGGDATAAGLLADLSDLSVSAPIDQAASSSPRGARAVA